MSLQRDKLQWLPCWGRIIWSNSVGWSECLVRSTCSLYRVQYLLFHALLMCYWNLKDSPHCASLPSRVMRSSFAETFRWIFQVESGDFFFFGEFSDPEAKTRDKSCFTPQVRVMALHVRWCFPILNLISGQAAFSKSSQHCRWSRDTYCLDIQFTILLRQ